VGGEVLDAAGVKSLLIAPVLSLALAAPVMAQETEWDYEGERGPSSWGSLDPAFATAPPA
jgi:carbonic anhydrase